jgi:hypothetical protein
MNLFLLRAACGLSDQRGVAELGRCSLRESGWKTNVIRDVETNARQAPASLRGAVAFLDFNSRCTVTTSYTVPSTVIYLEASPLKTFRASIIPAPPCGCLRKTAYGNRRHLHEAAYRLDVAAEMTSLNTFTIRSTSPRSGLIAVIPM